MLSQNTSGEAFGHTVLGNDVVDASPAASLAQKFPEAASSRVSFSKVKSEIASGEAQDAMLNLYRGRYGQQLETVTIGTLLRSWM
ncbi:hypothetical protein Mchl_3373 [Methylorubrum extorquens CM4]|uniref:Uncharacterized protein n=1 Tax=Methylorubrum extorquens (strain CM4 / NCIMB 13688) TaxID=440085 RepID=B7KTY6_METC4|nr:hypothetical protein [Methylorubrum extorquens]ACK84196.1 hypothetical protein Mchl_3373 [Methylorubrum extorquens CM4]